ncbi:MAG: pyridoxamine 5'-phosphate oxidase family protein [Clostridia bacterium]|nr:pyridoxamine 5'-phosphate oxidase family protein [Clostridia bacterium]
MQKTGEFLKECGVFYLATADGDQPRVRPFGATAVFEDKLYLITGNGKDVFAQMMKDPKIEISGTAPDGRWIRLTAKAVRDGRVEARRAMLEQNPDLRAMYDENDGVMEVFYLTGAEAKICSFTAAPEIERF